MSTRSAIGLVNDNGSITGIYCHYDGWLQGVGATLDTYYTDMSVILKVLHIGNLNQLMETPDQCMLHSNLRATYNTPQFKNIDDFERYFGVSDYYYLFCNNTWLYRRAIIDNRQYSSVRQALADIKI